MTIAIVDAKEVNRRIDAFQKSGKEMDTEIHVLAVSCLFHAEKHGDNTLLTKLVNSCGKAVRAKALIHWACTYGALSYVKDESGNGKFKANDKKKYFLDKAEATPFFDLTREKNPKEFSLETLLKMVERKLDAGVKAKKVTKDGLGAFVRAIEGHTASLIVSGKLEA